MLTAVVLAKNEEGNIKDCLKTIAWCDELIIIDDYSQDHTIRQAQNYNLKVKIFQRHLNNNFAAQRNFGLEKTRGDWVLFIDADERITPALAKEIKYQILNIKNQKYISKIKKNEISGFYIKRKDRFLGRWLKYGETADVKLLRLAKRNSGKWEEKVHEIWEIKGRTKTLKNPLLHERNLTIGQFLSRINFYSSIRSKELYQQGVKTNIILITLHPLAKFIQNYIFYLGFLDGIQGFIFAMMMSLHSFLVRAKLWVRQQNQGREKSKGSDRIFTSFFILWTALILTLYFFQLLCRGGLWCLPWLF